jgi:DNA invertase Pin-like site-specific DNA recombinase
MSKLSSEEEAVKVGIYARVSTDAQEARGTIGSQLDTLRARVAAEGDELVGEFIDDGYSGARLDRPGLDALRDAAEAGIIDVVWCLSPDRLARSYAYQILILEELARFDVAVRFADAPPLDDPQGRLLVQIQGVIAEHERAKFAERGRRGKLYRSRSGEVLSTKVPYGYRRVARGADGPAHVVIYEPEAAVVRRVFSDFLAGHSLRHLAVALSNDGSPRPRASRCGGCPPSAGCSATRPTSVGCIGTAPTPATTLPWAGTAKLCGHARSGSRYPSRPSSTKTPSTQPRPEHVTTASTVPAGPSPTPSCCAGCCAVLPAGSSSSAIGLIEARQQPATTSARIAIRGVPVARTAAAPNGASEPTNSMPSCSTRYASCSPDPTCSPPVKRPWPNRLRRPTTSYSPPNWTDSNADSRPPAANEDGSPTFTRLE